MKIIRELIDAATNKHRIEILKGATDNEKEIFRLTCDPQIKFGIKSIEPKLCDVEEPTEAVIELLNKLHTRELTGNAATDAVYNMVCKSGKLINLVLRKRLGCGVSVSALNKAYGSDFIPVFKLQLADTALLQKIRYPALSQLKYDGVRVVATKQYNTVVLKTRSGKVFKFPELENDLLKSDFDFVLDGELVLGEGKLKHRSAISGIVNSAIRGTPIENDNVFFTVFDHLTPAEFANRKCDRDYSTRYYRLVQVVENVDSAMIRTAVSITVSSESAVQSIYDNVIRDGFEGLIIKHADHKYKFKRTKDWIKVKATKDTELTCIGYEEGEGQFEGMIGSLLCNGNVEGRKVVTRVGSGLSVSDRNKHPDEYLGKKIKVLYNSVTINSSGYYNLFLTRFNCVREDI